MEIHNHGIDTIGLLFSTSGYSPKQLSDLSFRIKTIENLKKSQNRPQPNTYYTVNQGFIDDIHFYSKEIYSIVTFSVPRLLYDNNVDGATFDDIKKVIPIISEKLEIDVRYTKVRRLDYCFNFSSDLNWDDIVDKVYNNCKSFDYVRYNSSAYIKNDSREVVFYDQLGGRYDGEFYSNDRGIINQYKKKLNRTSLFRVELRLFRDILNKMPRDGFRGKGLRLPDLLNDENVYNIFQKYRKLVKIPKYEENRTRGKLNKFKIQLPSKATITDINRINHALALFLKNGSHKKELTQDKFLTKHHFDTYDDEVKAAILLLDNMELNLKTNEQPSEIKDKIIHEIDNLFERPPQPLFEGGNGQNKIHVVKPKKRLKIYPKDDSEEF